MDKKRVLTDSLHAALGVTAGNKHVKVIVKC